MRKIYIQSKYAFCSQFNLVRPFQNTDMGKLKFGAKVTDENMDEDWKS